jgi:hypothetical protein
MKFQDLVYMYNSLMAEAESFMYKKILPPLFKVMLLGLKITLFWAFYQTVKNVGNELF